MSWQQQREGSYLYKQHGQLLHSYTPTCSLDLRGKPPAACQEELLGGAQLEASYGIISYQVQVDPLLLAPDSSTNASTCMLRRMPVEIQSP